MKPHDYDLTIEKLIDASPADCYKAWGEHLEEWFVPDGVELKVNKLDLRTGGEFSTAMTYDGNTHEGTGVFLEVTPNERIVWTDAYHPGWVPNPEKFFTAITTFEPQDGKTLVRATARHWSKEVMENHKEMGFFEGWGQTMDKLEKVAVRIAGR